MAATKLAGTIRVRVAAVRNSKSAAVESQAMVDVASVRFTAGTSSSLKLAAGGIDFGSMRSSVSRRGETERSHFRIAGKITSAIT